MKCIRLLVIISLLTWTKAVADSKSDVEELMNALLSFGIQMLEKYGEFIPYGGAMKSDGEITFFSGYHGDEQQFSQDVIDLLKDASREAAENSEYKATGIVYDVRVIPPDTSEKTDAITVALDHKDDYSVEVLLPYKLLNSEVQIGEIFLQAGANEIFSQ